MYIIPKRVVDQLNLRVRAKAFQEWASATDIASHEDHRAVISDVPDVIGTERTP